jgi:XTP/dITP diphosphohydrolase
VSAVGRRLLLATRNEGKVAELRRILAGDPRLADVELISAAEVAVPDTPETGETFAANAALKARAAAHATGLVAVADDSGLTVDALGGDPGVRSARYAGAHGDDAANLALVLQRMTGVADRAARFVCAAAVAAPGGGEPRVVHGEVRGELIDAPRGDGGFGYDPIFVPHGETRTTAEMAPAEKDAISHRGAAFRALCDELAQALTV